MKSKLSVVRITLVLFEKLDNGSLLALFVKLFSETRMALIKNRRIYFLRFDAIRIHDNTK